MWVDIQWQANFTSVSPPVSPTSCVGPYPLSGYWNNFNPPGGSPPGPQISTGVDVLQFLDPGNMYFRVVYYPTTIPNPNGGTIAGPGWAYWYSRDGLEQFTYLGHRLRQWIAERYTRSGHLRYVGIYYYTGNRNGAVPGASILDVKKLLLRQQRTVQLSSKPCPVHRSNETGCSPRGRMGAHQGSD